MNLPSPGHYQSLLKTNVTDKDSLDTLQLYYERLTDAFPSLSAGHYVLGYCYYRQNRKELAFEQLRTACALEPDFFWGYYNLGLLMLKENQTETAARLFSLALSKDPKKTLQILLGSKVFRDILSAGLPYDPAASLQAAYLKTAQTLQLIEKNKAVPLTENGLQLF